MSVWKNHTHTKISNVPKLGLRKKMVYVSIKLDSFSALRIMRA